MEKLKYSSAFKKTKINHSPLMGEPGVGKTISCVFEGFMRIIK